MTPQQAQFHHWVFAPCAYCEFFWVDVVYLEAFLSRQVPIAKKKSEWNIVPTWRLFILGWINGDSLIFVLESFKVKPNGEGQGFLSIKSKMWQ